MKAWNLSEICCIPSMNDVYIFWQARLWTMVCIEYTIRLRNIPLKSVWLLSAKWGDNAFGNFRPSVWQSVCSFVLACLGLKTSSWTAGHTILHCNGLKYPQKSLLHVLQFAFNFVKCKCYLFSLDWKHISNSIWNICIFFFKNSTKPKTDICKEIGPIQKGDPKYFSKSLMFQSEKIILDKKSPKQRYPILPERTITEVTSSTFSPRRTIWIRKMPWCLYFYI